MYGDSYNYSSFGFLGSVFHLIVWVLAIWLIIVLIRHMTRGGSWHDALSGSRGPWKNTALDILKERYAKGEIQKEEFEQKKKDLI